MPGLHNNKKAAKKAKVRKKRKSKKETYGFWTTPPNNEQCAVGYSNSGYITNVTYNEAFTGLTGSSAITLGGELTGTSTIAAGSSNTFVGYNSLTNGYITYPMTYTMTPIWDDGIMLFENEFIKIGEKCEVLIDGKIELNPTKIGRMLLKALESRRKEELNDPKDFFNKG